MPGGWDLLIDIMATLAAAFLLGTVMERFRQSAILGYILAGVILGPGLLGVIRSLETVQAIAELGVALLLFSIGLEFSWKHLIRLGSIGIGGGSLQIALTMGVTWAIATSMGMDTPGALSLGAVAALSSTVVVMKALKDSGDLDASHGKAAVGVLILQDIAFVPLVLLLTALGGERPDQVDSKTIGPAIAQALAVVLVLVFLGMGFLPRVLRSRALARNRELPILLAVIVCMGTAWAAHSIGFSPSIGAFIGGILLSETSYADQIRADIGPLRTMFATIFFASIGMLANARWIGEHFALAIAFAALLVVGKAVLTFGALRLFRLTTIASLGAALSLAQVGELSFVLLHAASTRSLIDASTVQLVTSASVISLAACPLLVGVAPQISRFLAMRLVSVHKLAEEERQARKSRHRRKGHVIVIGYGEAGRTAAIDLRELGMDVLVLETNSRLVEEIREAGLQALLGDGTQAEILEGTDLESASGLLVALSDHRSARMAVSAARKLAPELPIVARARYHLFSQEIAGAGANRVVDEETEVARKLAGEMADQLGIFWDHEGREHR